MSTTPTIKLESLISDDDAEWVDLDEVLGASVLVRPIDFPPYTQARQALLKRMARAYKDEPVPERVIVPALGKLYAQHILLGWKGFDTEYSAAEAEARMGDWAWRKLTRQVEWAAAKLTAINTEMVDDASKNSAPPSATS